MRSCLGCFGVLLLVLLVAGVIGAFVNGDTGTALVMALVLGTVVVIGVRRGLKA